MSERMQVQREVMQHLGAISYENGRTVPGARFQEVAVKFAQVYAPNKSASQIENEIKRALTN